MRALFIAGIEHLTLRGALGRGDKVADSAFLITNEREVVKNLLTGGFEQCVGSIEVRSLLSRGAVAYSVEDDVEGFAREQEGIDYLNRKLARVRTFLQSLWLLRDNAVDVELGFVECPYRSRPAVIYRNFYPDSYTNSAGLTEPMEFGREELRQARGMYGAAPEPILNPQIALEKSGRLSKAFYFMQGARSTRDLAIKVANYITALEALFSGEDTTELAHRLSERVAVFLESEPGARVGLYRNLKRAYAIRSKCVHGAAPGKVTRDQLLEASRTCDNALRRAFLRIFKEPDLTALFEKRSDLDEFLLRMTLTQGAEGGP
jgi:hypothetical protein